MARSKKADLLEEMIVCREITETARVGLIQVTMRLRPEMLPEIGEGSVLHDGLRAGKNELRNAATLLLSYQDALLTQIEILKTELAEGGTR